MAEAKYIFEKLTPITDSDISVYESAIDFVFENNDVKNIALSGAYGAGKSSVLASYKSSHPDTKFLHISLAHFQDDQNNASSDAPIKESILEGKILNQLIHQIPAEKIPQTNFRVKKSTGNGAIICYNRSKISRNYWLFEPKCRNNAEITYTQRLQIASYFP